MGRPRRNPPVIEGIQALSPDIQVALDHFFESGVPDNIAQHLLDSLKESSSYNPPLAVLNAWIIQFFLAPRKPRGFAQLTVPGRGALLELHELVDHAVVRHNRDRGFANPIQEFFQNIQGHGFASEEAFFPNEHISEGAARIDRPFPMSGLTGDNRHEGLLWARWDDVKALNKAAGGILQWYDSGRQDYSLYLSTADLMDAWNSILNSYAEIAREVEEENEAEDNEWQCIDPNCPDAQTMPYHSHPAEDEDAG